MAVSRRRQRPFLSSFARSGNQGNSGEKVGKLSVQLNAFRDSVRLAIKALLPRTLVVQRLDRRAANTVLLTFDDGPHRDVTPAVLERLELFGAKAVFFVVGHRIKKAPGILEQIRKRGHLIGNHSHLHRRSYVLQTQSPIGFRFFYRDAQRCQDVIERNSGGRPKLFRPPGGRLTPTTVLVPQLLGLRCLTWSVDVGDWQFRSASEAHAGAEELLRRIAAGDIVLLHDDNRYVLDLLDTLLPGLSERQYDLATGIRCV
jgi:peptidoglycan/xylan/chitin deacetylase (PgdA/CDA1 family)